MKMHTLIKNNDHWGEWFELAEIGADQKIIEFNLGFKIIDGTLMEIEGSYVCFRADYIEDEIPWSKVVSFDNEGIKKIIVETFGLEYDSFPVVNAETEEGFKQLAELKRAAGYLLNEYGEYDQISQTQVQIKNRTNLDRKQNTMSTNKVWNVKFVAGNPEIFTKITTAAGGPFKRSEALADAATVAGHNWRAWVEHVETGERIFESEVEKEFVKKHSTNTIGKENVTIKPTAKRKP